jgi:putative DNA primase/helicase
MTTPPWPPPMRKAKPKGRGVMTNMPCVDLNLAEDFLTALDPDGEQFTFQTFDDREDHKNHKDLSLTRVLHGTLAQHWDELCSLNERGAGIFVTINRTDLNGREKQNIIAIRAVFIDLDGAPLEPVRLAPKPFLITQSSPERWHAYWRVARNMPLADYTPLQKRLIAHFHSDASVHDLPRVMRIPGFIHRKREPFLSRIVEFNDDAEIPDWESFLPKPEPQIKPEKPKPDHYDDLPRSWQQLNDMALRDLSAWVPTLYPSAKRTSAGGYRVSSQSLGRNLEEDLSFSPEGIKDFGVHDLGDPNGGSRTPIDAVIERFNCDFKYAVAWLANALGEDERQYQPHQRKSNGHDGFAEEEKPGAERVTPPKAKKKGGRDNKDKAGAPAGLQDNVALEFAAQHVESFRYVAIWNRWMQWEGHRWRVEDTLAAFDEARKLCRAAGDADAKVVAAVVTLARSDRRLAATSEQWDRDKWLLGTPDGVVDLKTGKLRPSSPEDYITKVTTVAPAGDCPLWRQFLARVTGQDAELQKFLQRVCGYALTGNTSEDALFFFYGTGANGKSVFLRTIAGILGDHHTTASMEMFTVTNSERHPTDLADLRGARLVTAIETEEGKRWDEAKIKALTGGDRIKARFMRQDFFEYTPQFKLLVAGNHRPSIRTIDEAIRRRMNLIPFTVTIPEQQRDLALADKLKAEWPGILAWMIDGCMNWQRQGLQPPNAVVDATEEYLEAEDALKAFIEEQCEIGSGRSDSINSLWKGWKAWAEGSGEYVGSKRKFGQKLVDKGFPRTKGAKGRRDHLGIYLVGDAYYAAGDM